MLTRSPKVLGEFPKVLAAVMLTAAGGAATLWAQTGTLRQQVDTVAAKGGVAWVTYRVPIAGSQPRRMCCFDGTAGQTGTCCGQCVLERGDGVVLTRRTPPSPPANLLVEPPSEMRVFARIENGVVVRVRTFSLDCEVDYAGATVTPLKDVTAAESAAWLASLVSTASADNVLGAVQIPALSALGLHPGDGPTSTLLTLARTDPRPRIRSQALVWLAERAASDATTAIGATIENDPEIEVKRRAVFAVSQLPPEKGVPLLIELARTHRQPEVRRQAMFWLGQSKDPRAVDLFEQVLRGR